MKMKRMVTCIATICFGNFAFAQDVSELKARLLTAQQTIQMLNTQLHAYKSTGAKASPRGTFLSHLLAAKTAGPLDCDPPGQTCAQDCTLRESNGTCVEYGADFCGVDAVCSENCTLRESNGTCVEYATDYCGEDANCASHCTLRESNGTCVEYATDFCGRDANCSPDCTLRESDGTCVEYGPDICN